MNIRCRIMTGGVLVVLFFASQGNLAAFQESPADFWLSGSKIGFDLRMREGHLFSPFNSHDEDFMSFPVDWPIDMRYLESFPS